MSETKGRVTIPTDLDVIPETLKMLDEWGADAIRDCDGTEFPAELKKTGAKNLCNLLYHQKGQCLGKGPSGRNPADVYHDIPSHGSVGYSGNPSDGSSVSGYAGCEYKR